MNKNISTEIAAYNSFCRNITEGSILYNIDSTNLWGDYLLVASKQVIRLGSIKTYTLLLLGLQKKEEGYVSRNLRITLTPDYASRIPFLKYVGFCKFELYPVLSETNINLGLVSVYSQTDLHKYTRHLNIRKPQKKKYDREGKPIIKKLNN